MLNFVNVTANLVAFLAEAARIAADPEYGRYFSAGPVYLSQKVDLFEAREIYLVPDGKGGKERMYRFFGPKPSEEMEVGQRARACMLGVCMRPEWRGRIIGRVGEIYSPAPFQGGVEQARGFFLENLNNPSRHWEMAGAWVGTTFSGWDGSWGASIAPTEDGDNVLGFQVEGLNKFLTPEEFSTIACRVVEIAPGVTSPHRRLGWLRQFANPSA